MGTDHPSIEVYMHTVYYIFKDFAFYSVCHIMLIHNRLVCITLCENMVSQI